MNRRRSLRGPALIGAGVVAALAGAAVCNAVADRLATYKNPPRGRFVEIDGQIVHWLEQGTGMPVLLVHGNGATVEELIASGLVEALSRRHRVILLDRPGFGHSPPPPGRPWGVRQHAELLARFIDRLELVSPVVIGQSIGASIALALALDRPERVRGLVLVSGYFKPIAERTLAAQRPFNVPLLGPLIAATIAPLVSRAFYTLAMRRIFAPQAVPERFMRLFPHGLAVRRSQLFATGYAAGRLRADMRPYWRRARSLRVPAVIFAGDGDRVLSSVRHAAALRDRVPRGRAGVFGMTGHMAHHAHPEAIAAAVADLPAIETGERDAARRPAAVSAV